MTTLSPAAFILKAFDDCYKLGLFDQNWQETCLAAALEAVADQLVPAEPEDEDLDYYNRDDNDKWQQWFQRQHTRSQLLAIAAELRAQ